MSYYVTIGQWDGNYTSNIGKLFHKHIIHPSIEGYTGLQAMHGMTGAEALPMLAAAWESINAERHALGYTPSSWKDQSPIGEPAMSALYDAPNGWGSLIGGLIFLGEITAACGMYPQEIIHVSA